MRWKFSKVCIYVMWVMSQNHGSNSHCYFNAIFVNLKYFMSWKVFFSLILLGLDYCDWVNYYISLYNIYFLASVSCSSVINSFYERCNLLYKEYKDIPCKQNQISWQIILLLQLQNRYWEKRNIIIALSLEGGKIYDINTLQRICFLNLKKMRLQVFLFWVFFPPDHRHCSRWPIMVEKSNCW